MRRSRRAGWVSLAVALSLLAGSLVPSTPLSAVSGSAGQSKTQKQSAAAVKRLQRQRKHMERQRARLKDDRQRFKDKREALRAKVKALKAEAKTKAEEEDDESGIWSGFFPWVTSGGLSDNLWTGLGLTALGAGGALILVFGLIGSYLPSMGGKAEYEALLLSIKALESKRDEQIARRESFVRTGEEIGADRRREAASLTDDLNRAIQSKEEDARRKYRRVLWLGIPIYVLVGGGLAVLLATNALQALLIGFAWTSIAERLGMKQETKEKESVKDPTVAELAKEARKAIGEVAEKKLENEQLKKSILELTETIGKMKEA